MSMQSGLGAAQAAQEILDLIDIRTKEGAEYLIILREVIYKANEIKTGGKDVWY